jgi:hypothetical protein
VNRLSREGGTKSKSVTESDLRRIEIKVGKFTIDGTCDMTSLDVETDNDQFLPLKFWIAVSKSDLENTVHFMEKEGSLLQSAPLSLSNQY